MNITTSSLHQLAQEERKPWEPPTLPSEPLVPEIPGPPEPPRHNDEPSTKGPDPPTHMVGGIMVPVE